MPEKRPWYVTKRADALALVYLTGREELLIEGPRPNEFPRFEVRCQKRERSASRLFGVEVEADGGPLSEERWRQMVGSARHRLPPEGVGYPICLFLIDTVSSEARYTWLVAPTVASTGQTRLVLTNDRDTEPMSYATINEIVGAVDRFYDALVVPVAA